MAKKARPQIYIRGGRFEDWDGSSPPPEGALYGHVGDGLWCYFGGSGTLLPHDSFFKFVGDELDAKWELMDEPQYSLTPTGRMRKRA